MSTSNQFSIYTTDELESWIAEDDENNLMSDDYRNAVLDEIDRRRCLCED